MADKDIKKEFKKKASKDPEKYYAVDVLRSEGFERKRCSCGTFFWTTSGRERCGDPACSGGFTFFDKSPAKKQLDYVGVWKEFSGLFKKWGYTPIERYPVTARWRQDTDFVQASIYDFQPFVVSGEVSPPANPLVVPQFCLRFNDIDNVGITGAHYTGFVMIGQHAFMRPEEWDQQKYFSDIHNWLKQGIGLPNDEITFHEDAWAGGGNFGPCMEYFSRGLELGNQVYMLYEQTPKGHKELDLKVLDMGMGHERNAWFTKATSTSYETTFPTVMKKLRKITGIKTDDKMISKFLPYSSYLNADEVEDLSKVWQDISQKTGYSVDDLQKNILPLSGLYSVAEHSRSLLVALADGALPSNTGGGYNLRVILRRALSFIDRNRWDLDLAEIAEWHADYLKPLFPELSENVENVRRILDVEKKKFRETRKRSRSVVSRIIKEDVDADRLVELYDSQGISPEMVRDEAKQMGKEIEIPDNFYAMVAERHEQAENVASTSREEKVDTGDVHETEALYYDDYRKIRFTARVMKIDGRNVLLERTYFYPTSGGQLHDTGTMDGNNVLDVFKQGRVIVHVLEKEPGFKEGKEVYCEIDFGRRKQLAQHHTATHIVNAAAKKVLGSHINQAGARKTEEKASLDVTHYQGISDDELSRIEKEANRIVEEDVPVHMSFMPREDAEKKFGMSLYQGGVVPGKTLRIVDIENIDTEACGGTHLHSTKEAEKIKLIRATKISDGIVRIEFKAGAAVKEEEEAKGSILADTAKLLGVKEEQVPGRAEELFRKWKKAKKAVKKKKDLDTEELELISDSEYDSDALSKTAEVFKTQPEHVARTAKRFLKELEEMKEKLKS